MDIGLRLGIEGEKQFKFALRDINQSFKVLGSEMLRHLVKRCSFFETLSKIADYYLKLKNGKIERAYIRIRKLKGVKPS